MSAGSSVETPQRLYKYLRPEHVSSFLAGNLYLQNLAAFRQIEDKARGDRHEGMHVDNPAKPFEVQHLLTVRQATEYRTAIKFEGVFALCLSTALDRRLLEEFGGAVIEISDATAFLEQLRRKVSRYSIFATIGLLCGPVNYQRTHAKPKPFEIPFLKRDRFHYQQEYRAVCGYKKAFELTESIVNAYHSDSEEAALLKKAHRVMPIGDLRGIAREVTHEVE